MSTPETLADPAPESPSIFGRIITGDDVEQAVLALLRRWSGTYLAELERQHDLEAGTLPRIRSYETAPSFDNWPEDQIPACIVVSPGITGPPVRGGRGSYMARWSVGLGCVCSARTQAEAHRLGMLYIAALKTLILQRPSLEGFAAGVDWVDESYTELSFDDRRTLGAGMAIFNVQVDDVVTAQAGPLTPADPLDPDTSPWPEWPHADTVTVDVAGTPVTRPDPKEE